MNRLSVLLAKSFRVVPKITQVGARTISYTSFRMEAKDPATETKETVDSDIVDRHETRINELESEIKDMQDRLLRSYAEEENVRRIARKDVEDARNFANTKFAKSLLDVADNLERALEAAPAEKCVGDKAESTLKSLVEGVNMTKKELFKTFSNYGVVKYGELGEKFDPNIHDALFQLPTTEENCDKEGTIGTIVKSGFMLKTRVLRPAEVGIFVAPVPPKNDA